MNITVASENALILYFGDSMSPENTRQIAAFLTLVHNEFAESLIDWVPSYISLLLIFNPDSFDIDAAKERLSALFDNLSQQESVQSIIHHPIRVCYDERIAPDLVPLSKSVGISTEELIDIHSSTLYTVYAIGFMPNFAFLGIVDKRINYPRHATPRKSVAAGSVGIAENQTGIYPSASPGGWQIIGVQPDLNQGNPPTKESISVGDTVSFNPISYDEFRSLTDQAEVLT